MTKKTMKTTLQAIFVLLLLVCPPCRAEKLVYLNLRHLNQVDYADSAAVLAMWDELHAASTLQGIVNRKRPRLYIDYVVNGEKAIDAHWWSLFRSKGEWLAGRDTLALASVEEAVAYFARELRGAVAYDSNVASTSNVASAIAGIENLLAVRFDPAPGSLYSRLCLAGPRLPVSIWLVRQDGTPLFTGRGTLPGCRRNSSGSVKCDPYLWFVEQYMKTGRCPARHAGYYPDQFWRTMPTRTSRNHHQLTNHDFFVSRRGFFFDLSPWGDEPATDDPSQPAGTDFRTLQELLHTADSLGGGSRMCHIGGFPHGPSNTRDGQADCTRTWQPNGSSPSSSATTMPSRMPMPLASEHWPTPPSGSTSPCENATRRRGSAWKNCRHAACSMRRGGWIPRVHISLYT